VLTLNELRELIHRQLIEEANVMDLANRQLDRVAIVSYMNGRMTSLIAISTSEIVNHEGVPIPKVLGLAQAVSEYDANYRLHRLYAENAVVSIVLLAAALEYWKSVFADYSVSPAAQQVIKRYFDQNKDNPNLVELEADTAGRAKHPDFLRAAYLGPVGFDIAGALAAGDKAIAAAGDPGNWGHDDVRDMIVDAAFNGFDRAYSDDVKTKRSFDDLFREDAYHPLFKALMVAIQSGSTNKSKAVAWANQHVDDLLQVMQDLTPQRNKQDAEIEHWWTSTILPNLD